MNRKSGFSLVEILVVVAIIALLIGILVPALTIVRQKANQAKSANNLKQIYAGLIAYDQENGTYPKYTAVTNAAAVGFQGGVRGGNNSTVGSLTASSFNNNVTAALWLLVRDDKTPPEMYANPSNTDVADPLEDDATPSELWDFNAENNFSYSFINFYDSVVDAKWGSEAGASYVLAGDDNDTGLTAETDSANSSNHGGNGQNFMFGDGHATWHTTPMSAFSKSDNAYTYLGSGNTPSNATTDASATVDGSTIVTGNLNEDVFLVPIDAL